MAIEKLAVEQFLEYSKHSPVLDVRSPGEYEHAHIPGALSLPLFTNEERRIVGTAYKQEGRETAIKIGLDFFGPKMKSVVEEVEAFVQTKAMKVANNENDLFTSKKSVLVHCWRGGMRSAAIAWLLDLYGFKVFTLSGGYKKFRHFVLDIFEQPFNFKILGGFTGSGKTNILKQLGIKGEIIVDLENIANHKGSAFGALGQPAQPSQEMFENKLAVQLQTEKDKLNQMENRSSIWLEDESQRIGSVNIPQPIWDKMRNSSVYFLDIPFEERLTNIVNEYGNLDKENMIDAIIRIRKKLGGLETKIAIQHLQEEKTLESFRILLKYYDRHYLKGLNNRDNLSVTVEAISCTTTDPISNSEKLLQIKYSSSEKLTLN